MSSIASAAFHLNGGEVGVKASVGPGAAIVATLDSLDGVSTVAWEISTTDETSSVSDYALSLSGQKNAVCSTTSLGAGTAAILKCTVNGGIDPATGLEDKVNLVKTAKFYVPTAGGLEVGCAGEEYESDTTFGSTGIINAAIRGATGTTTIFAREVLVAGSYSTDATSAAPLIIGATYFSPALRAPLAGSATFRALLETSDVSVGAYVDLYDYSGVTNAGSPNVVTSSQLSTNSLEPDLVSVDVSAELLGVESAGLFQLRLWAAPTIEGEQVTCTFAAIDFEP